MTTANGSEITITIRGARAERGVGLSDFESFIDNFLAALRDYDRAARGEQTRKPGHPERRAGAVTAFRLVRFQPGSGIATLEAEHVTAEDDQLPIADVPLSLATLRDLTRDLANVNALPDPVVEALAKACRAVGHDGSFAIDMADEAAAGVVVSSELLDRIGGPSRGGSDDETRSVSGRLHLLDLEPDRLGIRSASGVEWTCRYPEELEEHIKSLLDRVVWASGSGTLKTPLRGSMTIERIEAVDEAHQSAIFTSEPVDDRVLLDRQGITAPQGLDALSDPEWDDESDEAYLVALLSK